MESDGRICDEKDAFETIHDAVGEWAHLRKEEKRRELVDSKSQSHDEEGMGKYRRMNIQKLGERIVKRDETKHEKQSKQQGKKRHGTKI